MPLRRNIFRKYDMILDFYEMIEYVNINQQFFQIFFYIFDTDIVALVFHTLQLQTSKLIIESSTCVNYVQFVLYR